MAKRPLFYPKMLNRFLQLQGLFSGKPCAAHVATKHEKHMFRQTKRLLIHPPSSFNICIDISFGLLVCVSVARWSEHHAHTNNLFLLTVHKTTCKHFYFFAGGLGESRHEGNPGHSRPRHHTQLAGVSLAQRPHHLEPAYQKRAGRGPRAVHVSDQHGSNEESGEYPTNTSSVVVVGLVLDPRLSGCLCLRLV